MIRLTRPLSKGHVVSASRSGRKLALATTLTGLVAAPLAVIATSTPAHAAPVTIQVLGDQRLPRPPDQRGRHGRDDQRSHAGAAILAGAVKQLRAANPNTVFAAAGDLIGASTFESFIQHDKPTLDALNAAGLDVSAAGNHEFDAGYNDLVNRVMKPSDATTNPEGGANWQYIAANVRKKSDSSYALPGRRGLARHLRRRHLDKDVGGVEVGFVGAVTEDLPSARLARPASPTSRSPASSPRSTPPPPAQGRRAPTSSCCWSTRVLRDDQLLRRLPTTTRSAGSSTASTPTSTRSSPATPTWPTTASYNGRPGRLGRAVRHEPQPAAASRSTPTRRGRGHRGHLRHRYLKAQTTPFAANFPADPPSPPSSTTPWRRADVLGAVELGKLAGPFNRARLADGTTENRGGESTLGNLVAEVQRWATRRRRRAPRRSPS